MARSEFYDDKNPEKASSNLPEAQTRFRPFVPYLSSDGVRRTSRYTCALVWIDLLFLLAVVILASSVVSRAQAVA